MRKGIAAPAWWRVSTACADSWRHGVGAFRLRPMFASASSRIFPPAFGCTVQLIPRGLDNAKSSPPHIETGHEYLSPLDEVAPDVLGALRPLVAQALATGAVVAIDAEWRLGCRDHQGRLRAGLWYGAVGPDPTF